MTTVGFMKFPSKFRSEISLSKATIHQKIFSKPRNGKGYFGAVLSKIVRQVGFSLVQDSSRFLDRVCNPCGRKIRKLDQLYYFVKNATTTTSTPVKTSKRNLDTPDKASPPWRKSKSVRIVPPLAILL